MTNHKPLRYFALLADEDGAKSVSSGLLLYFCLPPRTLSGLTPNEEQLINMLIISATETVWNEPLHKFHWYSILFFYFFYRGGFGMWGWPNLCPRYLIRALNTVFFFSLKRWFGYVGMTKIVSQILTKNKVYNSIR